MATKNQTKKKVYRFTDTQKDHIDRWMHALRFGNFKQTRNVMSNKKSGGYCPLGVACEVYRVETGNGEWVSGKSFFTSNARSFKVKTTVSGNIPPAAVMKWYGIDVNFADAVAAKCDNSHCSMSEIADYIEDLVYGF